MEILGGLIAIIIIFILFSKAKDGYMIFSVLFLIGITVLIASFPIGGGIIGVLALIIIFVIAKLNPSCSS